MIKNIIFDFGKVLVDYDFDAVINTFFATPEETEPFRQLVCSQEWMDRSDLGDIPFSEFIRTMQQEYPQWSKEIKMFEDRFQEFVLGEIPGMRALLTRLKEKGYPVYGLTNWSEAVHETIRRHDILQMLDGRVISSEVQLIKPDMRIYQLLCDTYGLKPEECVFIDDRMPNVVGAKAAGMQALLFTGAEQLERDLKELL